MIIILFYYYEFGLLISSFRKELLLLLVELGIQSEVIFEVKLVNWVQSIPQIGKELFSIIFFFLEFFFNLMDIKGIENQLI